MITRRQRAYELGRRITAHGRDIVGVNVGCTPQGRAEIELALQRWLESWVIPDIEALLDAQARSEFQRGVREATPARRPLGPRPEAAS